MAEDVRYCLGIDGGLSGALALVSSDGDIPLICDTPRGPDGGVDLKTLVNLFRTWPIDFVCFEKGQEMVRVDAEGFKRRQGHVYPYAFCNGSIYGAAYACSLLTVIVEPQAWKRHMHLLGKDKEASRTLATEFWPSGKVSIWPNKGHHNRAEAALIARYGLEAFPELRAIQCASTSPA